MRALVACILAVVASACARLPPRPSALRQAGPYRGGPWHGLGGSASGCGVSGPLNATPQGIAADRHGRPHIIWDLWVSAPKRTTQVCYAYWDGRQWVGLGGSMGDGGVSHSDHAGSTRARLALDRAGRPHVVWINNRDYTSIEYRHWDGARWEQRSIPWVKSEAGQLALAVDGHCRPHIASLEGIEERDTPWPQVVCYRYWDGQRWRERTGNDGGYVYTVRPGDHLDAISLALDAHDRPHLAWGEGDSFHYAYWDGERWAELGGSSRLGGVHTVAKGSFTPSLALGPEGRPHIAWREIVGGDGRYPLAQIYYRYWDGRQWAERAGSASGAGLSTPGHNAFIPQLAIDPRSRPHVLWCAETGPGAPSEVFYKYWDGRQWREVAGSGSGSGLTGGEVRSNWTHLALDPRGRPHVTWGHHAHPEPPHVYYLFLPNAPP